jgi:hypothetical protein
MGAMQSVCCCGWPLFFFSHLSFSTEAGVEFHVSIFNTTTVFLKNSVISIYLISISAYLMS